MLFCAHMQKWWHLSVWPKIRPPPPPPPSPSQKTPKLLRQNASYLHQIVAYRPKLHEHDYQRSLDVDF